MLSYSFEKEKSNFLDMRHALWNTLFQHNKTSQHEKRFASHVSFFFFVRKCNIFADFFSIKLNIFRGNPHFNIHLDNRLLIH
jgi:hypothetical protein